MKGSLQKPSLAYHGAREVELPEMTSYGVTSREMSAALPCKDTKAPLTDLRTVECLQDICSLVSVRVELRREWSAKGPSLAFTPVTHLCSRHRQLGPDDEFATLACTPEGAVDIRANAIPSVGELETGDDEARTTV